jgi:glutamate 5-kinase
MTAPRKSQAAIHVRDEWARARRIVVKIGSSLLVDRASGTLKSAWLETLAADVATLVEEGRQVVLVSSGAIALGRHVLRFGKGPLELEKSQAAAAVGQISLAGAYQAVFAARGLAAAQILLTLGDTEERRRYLNARQTIDTLLALRAIPVVNENDTVATAEIRYGDNDRLSARVAQITPEIEAMAGGAGTELSRGGMVTKIEAGKIALASGTNMVITLGTVQHPLRALSRPGPCTWFLAPSDPASSSPRGWWRSMPGRNVRCCPARACCRQASRASRGPSSAVTPWSSAAPTDVSSVAGSSPTPMTTPSASSARRRARLPPYWVSPAAPRWSTATTWS